MATRSNPAGAAIRAASGTVTVCGAHARSPSHGYAATSTAAPDAAGAAEGEETAAEEETESAALGEPCTIITGVAPGGSCGLSTAVAHPARKTPWARMR